MAHSNDIIHKGSFVTIIRKICDRYSILRYTILTALLFSVVGCGSKKKTTEINKSVYKEYKDYYLRQLDSMRQEIEYRNAIIALSIEPVDPKIPNTAKFVKTETGFEYEGENSKVGAKSQKEENKVRTEKGSEKEVEDKGEVYASNETKNTDLDREGSSGGWVKIVWGFVFLAAILAIGKWKKWF